MTKCDRPKCRRRAYHRGLCWTHYRATTRPRLSAAHARHRLTTWKKAGATKHQIARATGLHPATIARILGGQQAVNARTAHAIITAEPPQPIGHPAHGAQRRLRALRAAGATPAELARWTGLSRSTITRITYGNPRQPIGAHTRAVIARTFTAHQADPVRRPPEDIAARMWPLPYEWDDDQLDQRHGKPETHGHTLKHRYREYQAGRWPHDPTATPNAAP